MKTLVLLTSGPPEQLSQEEPGSATNQLSVFVAQNPLVFHVIARFVAQGGNPDSHSSQFEHASLGLALLLNMVKDGPFGVKQVTSLSKS